MKTHNFVRSCRALCIAALLLSLAPQNPAGGAENTLAFNRAAHADQFSYAYLLNGFRKSPEDPRPDVLCIETGSYGLMLDVDNLATPRFGILSDRLTYEEVLQTDDRRLRDLPSTELEVAVAVNGSTYRAKTCKAGVSEEEGRLKSARMWESGRLVQHYDFQELVFKNDAGQSLACMGSLDLVAWPDNLTFTARVMPDYAYEDGPSDGVIGNGLCVKETPVDIPHRPELDTERFTLECWFLLPEKIRHNRYGWLLCKNGHEWEAGNFGFVMKHFGTLVGMMNIGGGRENVTSVELHGALDRMPGQWRHLAMTYDGRTMRIYVDGEEQGSRLIGKKRTPGRGLMRIGQRADGNFGVISGLYDQVRLWSRALSAEEIAAHTQNPARLVNREGLVMDRHFDQPPPVTPPVWTNAVLSVRFTENGRTHKASRNIETWRVQQPESLSLNCNFSPEADRSGNAEVNVAVAGGGQVPVRFAPEFNCHVAEVRDLQRSFDGGYVKITDYDEFEITLRCSDENPAPVPFLLHLRNPANITGLVPILCDSEGRPTGVHVQLSKNWHELSMGSYLRAFSRIPVRQGENRYRLRIAYGFYGTLPSASHAQLCLIGYGGNHRWDQVALACGGEAITFDADMSLTDVAVCDVRLPLCRHGKDGNPWGWTDAGWGGDWLGISSPEVEKLTFAGMKVAYLAHGPCLTDARYHGAYGAGRDVIVDARIRFPRTDDYGRTFQKLTYRFQRELKTADAYLMRRHARAFDSRVAYGNSNGLIAEVRVAPRHGRGSLLVPPTELTGPGPWWVAFPGRAMEGVPGYISWVIHDFNASLGGKTWSNPHLMVRVEERAGKEARLESWIVPPPEVQSFMPGDVVSLNAEWLHLAKTADHYGGPNEPYRRHLQENPRSWKTTYREVSDNRPVVQVSGGTLLESLPVHVRVEAPQVEVAVRGGLGFLPIRFEGLQGPNTHAVHEKVGDRLVPLNQAVHGNDFWQTDHDPAVDTYSLTVNVPVDGRENSVWVLKPVE